MPDYAVRTAFTATDRISPAFRQMGASAQQFGNRASGAFGQASRAGMMFRNVLSTVGVIGGLSAIVMGISGIVRESANLENSVADFTTLTGSVENARRTVDELQQLGAATPFEFGDLSQATKTLLGFGAATRQNLIPTLRMLGDAAGGNAERFDHIVLAFSQIKAGGRASMQDVNQLINAGVPILSELARVWGVSVGQARQMVSQGRATGEVVTQAFQNMTAAGGMFHQGMERASQTLTGRFSTFMDTVKVTAATIGTVFMPYLKSALDGLIELAEGVGGFIQRNQELIKTIMDKLVPALVGLIGLWITYRAMLLAAAFAQGAVAAVEFVKYMADMLPIMRAAIKAQGLYNFLLGGTEIQAWLAAIASAALSVWQGIQAAGTYALAAAQWVLNGAFLACPITWIVLGIMALIAVGVLLYRNWDYVKEKFSAAMTWMWEGIKTLGRGIMTALLVPVNLLITGIVKLLELASMLPGVGDSFAAAANRVRDFQAGMNASVGATNYFAPNQGQAERHAAGQPVNVNIQNRNVETRAAVTPRSRAQINQAELGFN